MGQADRRKSAPAVRHKVATKKERTREALIRAAIRVIARKGIEATSVLEITEALGISNGAFYYYFQNMEQLLEEVGHTVVTRLVEQIENIDEPDPAVRVARGPLMILQYVDQHPELRAIMLRVIDDPERLHAGLHERLRDDIVDGKRLRRFPVEDIDIAVRFCRAIVGNAVRLIDEGCGNAKLGALTAAHTLNMLGVPSWEAFTIVERVQERIARCESFVGTGS